LCTKLGPHNFEGKKLDEKQLHISQMFMCDVMYAYVWNRVQALGPELTVDIKCPNCNGEFPFAADLDTIEVTCCDDLNGALWDHTLRNPIPLRGREAKALRMGPSRWSAMETSQANAFNTGAIKLDVIRYSIHEVSYDGTEFEPVPVAEHELKKMSKFDIEKLAAQIDDKALGPDMSIDDKCRLCSRPFKTSIDWGYESFFGFSSP
jgi:hypothetical protein